MKILYVHNFYQQTGGEDKYFAKEKELLISLGNDVAEYTAHNDDIAKISSLNLAAKTIWNKKVYNEIRALIRKEKPDIVHFHNTFPLISPAAYHAVKAEGVAVVQTLHNFRLLCPGACLSRNDAVCEKCLTKTIPWPAVQHGCYRDDRKASAVLASMLAVHRMIGTWEHKIDRYIALTEFGRSKYIEGGLPAKKICVNPIFIPDELEQGKAKGSHALFIGRFTAEKGVNTLVETWQKHKPSVPLKLIGDGPLLEKIEQAATGTEHFDVLGGVSYDTLKTLLRDADFLVFPSIWYEGLPAVIIEAFVCGTPVIASDIGSMPSVITDQKTGLLFKPNDAKDLAQKISWARENPDAMAIMGQNARAEYERGYTPEINYKQLMGIYKEAIKYSMENRN